MSESLKRHERRQRMRELKEQGKRQGRQYPHISLPNRKSNLKTVEEENEAIQLLTEEQLKVYGQLLPGLLQKLSKIPNPRNLKKIKHQMTVTML